MKHNIILLALAMLVCAACANSKKPVAGDGDGGQTAAMPVFSADSAYAYCAAQCAFGPRTMNSAAHDSCGRWIERTFRRFGMAGSTHQPTLNGYDGTPLRATNIIARYRPEAGERVLLCAHWDSRPWADNDPDSANWRKPVMAANDGASGVAVLLELARIIGAQDSLELGVDFVCFDAEDWGVPQWSDHPDDGSSWALGAAHWADNARREGYKARFGILLDMVGGRGAHFYQEGISLQYAPQVVDKVWAAAAAAGHGSVFPTAAGGTVTDDHVPVNEIAGIPTVDIIPFYPDCAESSFGPTWHTVADNMDNIDRNTLGAVGRTVVQTLFSEP